MQEVYLIPRWMHDFVDTGMDMHMELPVLGHMYRYRSRVVGQN